MNDEKFRYIRRPKMKVGKRYRPASTYHQTKDGETSKCGGVRVGDKGFELVERERKVLLSMTCSNCLNNIVVSAPWHK